MYELNSNKVSSKIYVFPGIYVDVLYIYKIKSEMLFVNISTVNGVQYIQYNMLF